MAKLEAARVRVTDSREKPNGELKITTTFGLGTAWLTPRLGQFLDLYPEIKLSVIMTDEELDLGMREADVALRLREPSQPDLIRRRLFTVHYHLYAAAEYLKRYGQPHTLEDLDRHRLLSYAATGATFLDDLNALLYVGRDSKNPRVSAMSVNNMTALQRAVENGAGIAVLPDYLNEPESGLVRLMPHTVMPSFECYLVYPEEMKNVVRVQVFRDFLVSSAQRWRF
jgi:DNA-binding transcriptional LysR family regulator